MTDIELDLPDLSADYPLTPEQIQASQEWGHVLLPNLLSTCRMSTAGDAEFIDGWLLHCTTDNEGDRTRESLVAVYYPDGTRIAPPRDLADDAPISEQFAENARRQTRITCFPGLQPGDLAITPMNPLLYHRQRDYTIFH